MGQDRAVQGQGFYRGVARERRTQPINFTRANVACSVIASEAKQSILPRKERMDCFVASLLAMTEGMPMNYSVVSKSSRAASKPESVRSAVSRCSEEGAP